MLTVVSLRSRRLETLLGSLIADVSHDQVAALVNGAVPEDYDLDFKKPLYGNKDQDKRDLAGDVAAMANTAGGLIILGMDEDDQARATATPGVALSDAEHNRMCLIVAAQVAPLPVFHILPKEDPARPGTGFYLIAVPRSPSAPHAVRINDGFRFPRRNGRTTTYLSEPQLADAYRQRFAGFQSRLDAAETHEKYLLSHLDVEHRTFVVLTLVPDLDGYVEINSRSFAEFRTSMTGTTPLIVVRDSRWQRTLLRAGRLIADSSLENDEPTAKFGGFRRLSCVLHQSGAGSFAVPVARTAADDPAVAVDSSGMVDAVLSGLVFLAGHARDRAAAGGGASLRATVWPVDNRVPTVLTRLDGRGFRDSLGSTHVMSSPVATAVADLDDLAASGPPMVAVAHTLATGLMQEFGHPEAQEIAEDGTLRLEWWPRECQSILRSWAERVGVSLSSSTTTSD
jgi:hypothetical protein